MGYRSQVVLAMNKAAFMLFIEDVKGSTKEHKEEILSVINDTDMLAINKDGSVLLQWDSIKWYDNFDSISFLTDFINRINMISEDSYVGQAPTIHFNKIGEDYEDIEEISSCVDDNAFEIFIERNISFTVNNNEVTEKGFFNKIFEEEGKENEKKDSIL
jgi:hypothetical protein